MAGPESQIQKQKPIANEGQWFASENERAGKKLSVCAQEAFKDVSLAHVFGTPFQSKGAEPSVVDCGKDHNLYKSVYNGRRKHEGPSHESVAAAAHHVAHAVDGKSLKHLNH